MHVSVLSPDGVWQVLVDKDSNSNKGYGFVSYDDIPTAQNAMASLANAQLSGRTLRLGFAEDRPERDAAGSAPDLAV